MVKFKVMLPTLFAVCALGLSACGVTTSPPTDVAPTPSSHSSSGAPKTVAPKASTPPAKAPTGSIAAKLVTLTNAANPGPTKDYYWVSGKAKINKSAMPARGKVSFTPDKKGRSGVARASLTYAMFKASRGSRDGRPLDPPQWPAANPQVPVTYALTGRTYNGYFWNRSHSIGDALAGAQSYSSKFNFTSGTRQQNVGASSHGGMRAPEELAENYWKEHSGSKATIAYQTTPIYVGSERFPRGSIVNVLSSDGALSRKFVVINASEGYKLNYNTGSFTALNGRVKVIQPKTRKPPVKAPTPPRQKNTGNCTKTSTGSCIKPGQACALKAHGKKGRDATGGKLGCVRYPSGTWHWKR